MQGVLDRPTSRLKSLRGSSRRGVNPRFLPSVHSSCISHPPIIIIYCFYTAPSRSPSWLMSSSYWARSVAWLCITSAWWTSPSPWLSSRSSWAWSQPWTTSWSCRQPLHSTSKLRYTLHDMLWYAIHVLCYAILLDAMLCCTLLNYYICLAMLCNSMLYYHFIILLLY